MTSKRLKIFGPLLRRIGRAVIHKANDPIKARRRFSALARFVFKSPAGVSVSPDPSFKRGDEFALWVGSEGARPGKVILHLHGGGYILGKPRDYWKVVGHLSKASRTAAFVPHYRLAPEHKLPAPLEDVIAAWDHLRGLGYAPGDIILGGDSAGGGLALALLSHLGTRREKPSSVYLWSPFADQTFSGDAVVENAANDFFFSGDRTHELPEMILGDLSPADPRVSPLFATFQSPPPVFIQAAHTEILRDDAVRIAQKLKEARGEVSLEIAGDLPHVWHLFAGWLPEAGTAIERTAAAFSY